MWTKLNAATHRNVATMAATALVSAWLLFGQSSLAATPPVRADDTGSIGVASVLGEQQTGVFATTAATIPQRLFRGGLIDATHCTTAAAPSGSPTIGTFPATQHTFNNPFSFPVCHQFLFTVTNPAGCGGGFAPFFAAYSPAVVPAAAYTNVIGYSGASTVSPIPTAPAVGTNRNPQTFSAIVPANSDVVVQIIDGNTGASGGVACNYAVSAAPMLNTVYRWTDSFLFTATTAQTSRLFRGGAGSATKCLVPVTNTGAPSTGSFSGTGARHAFVNPFSTATCLDFKLTIETPNTTDCGNFAPTLAAYSPSYDPANPGTNLIGFPGQSATVGDPAVGFTATIQGGAPVVMVVSDAITPTTATTTCRYRVEASVAQSATPCSADIDGDGQFTATIDGLLLTRAQLGFSATAMVNGITFPGGAARSTGAAIRSYLNGSCGMAVAP